MNLIEKLGLEKCKAIVDGAPDAKYFGCSIDTAKYWVNQSNEYHSNPVFFPNMSRQVAYVLDDLRTAIADHERTDHCSDIKNHISPNTKVIEHEQKPKREVKHGFYDSNCW